MLRLQANILWVALVSLSGGLVACSHSESSNAVAMTAEQRKLDEKQISLAIRACLHKQVAEVEHLADTAEVVGKRLRERCEVPFAALRQAKLGYVDVPDIQNPPPLVVADEEAICVTMVQRFREAQRKAVQERLRQMPHGWSHPPIPRKPEENPSVEKPGYL
ncbi:hypothetical protein [Thiosulfativibrio zosterae]|uniref:Lipoprotein n=1 Tax=Thiosulfativibrio zosterae TaxID=2675053 RepID=A0A6F8PNI8_9GAMM|nr:hypothetical protein [Thiosulfativibrio zosterae]BBP43665.1 hypothetical protein THMIRHAT_14110 [Thiosulfativibrio zosterae]